MKKEHTTAVVISPFLAMGVLLAAMLLGFKLDVNSKKFNSSGKPPVGKT
jgi:hypothetical protein